MTIKIPIKGILLSFSLKMKRRRMHAMVIERVIQLNYLNVYLIISNGLVNAFSFADVKNTFMFSIERGKNLTKAIRDTPKTILA